MNTPLVLVVALPFVVLAAGCGGDGAEREMTGQLVAPECDGGWQVEGSQVTLRDEAGDIIGTATTSASRTAPVESPCVVDFSVADVPDAKFYTLSVGTHDGPAWSMAEMQAQDFQPVLTLGDAELPSWDGEGFCEALEGLADHFDDVDLLNGDTGAWNREVGFYRDAIGGQAAGIALDEDTSPGLLGAVLDSAESLRGVDGYQSAARLTRALDPVNVAVSEAHAAADCPGYWEAQGYTAG